jgi:dTDP-4-dehydrorhamnose 3,5-epimerase
MNLLNKIKINTLKVIKLQSGNVQHILKKSDAEFLDFGEAYFSWIRKGEVKAWKCHTKMTMNLVAPIGEISFVFTDNFTKFHTIKIGNNNYSRITVPPGIWFGFKGDPFVDGLILNIANIEHSSHEVLRKELNEVNFSWGEI